MSKMIFNRIRGVALMCTLSLLACSACGSGDEKGSDSNVSVEMDIKSGDIQETSIEVMVTIDTDNAVIYSGITYGPKGGQTVKEVHSETKDKSFKLDITGLQRGTAYVFTAFASVEGAKGLSFSSPIELETLEGDQPGDLEIPGYKIVFQDEFDVDGKPAAHWNYEIGQSIRNNEAQYYSDNIENAYVEGGYLHIVARKDHNGYNYTSSSMTTRDSFTYMYGKLRVRAKIPVKGGSWPAIWLLGNWWEWPYNGEIDVMEYYRGMILANACWGGTVRWQGVWDSAAPSITHFTDQDPDWVDKFHVWELDWNYDRMIISVDGEELNTIELNKTVNGTLYVDGNKLEGSGENPFRKTYDGFGHYLLVNLALGGNNGGTIDNSAFPMTYLIDYVRVYQEE